MKLMTTQQPAPEKLFCHTLDAGHTQGGRQSSRRDGVGQREQRRRARILCATSGP